MYKTEWWGACVVICLERGADLHMAQRLPLPLTVPCISKIQIGFTFLVPAHLGSAGHRAVKRVYVCMLLSRRSRSVHLARGRPGGRFHVGSGVDRPIARLGVAWPGVRECYRTILQFSK